MSPGQIQNPNRTPPQIIDEAAEWLVEMREPVVSAERRAAFAEWLRTSPMHVGAYLEIAKLWGDTAHLEMPADVDLQDLGAQNVVPLRADSVLPDEKGQSVSQRDRRWRLPARALAASLLVATTLVALLAWWNFGRTPSFATVAGEQRVITLEDGSVVRLNSRSELKVRLTSKVRRIDLLHGQALFEVAKDKARPFVVYSGGVVVRAVGTQFDVYRKNEGTIVTVVEGRVALLGSAATPPIEWNTMDQPDSQATLVGAGEQVTVRRSGAVERREKPNVAAATSWLRQELVFDGQELSAVVEEFNRYARVPIVVDDAELAHIRVNGVFHATDTEPLLSFISRYQGVRIDRARSQIRITRDAAAARDTAAPALH